MKAYLILTIALLALCTGAALAQEDPCGDENGAAYGLCNAYVAMECHTDNPSATETACSRVAAKFLQITGRDLPSKFTACPCSGIPEWEAFLGTFNYCDNNTVVNIVTLTDVPIGSSQEVLTAGGTACTYVNHVTGSFIVIDTTPEQASNCRQLVLDTAVSRGITCEPG